MAATVQHIDRKELYTSLPSRVRYLHSFLDFNKDDQAALAMAAPSIIQLIPAVVNIVYKKLLSYDITAQSFTTRSTSYSGPMDSFPSLDSPQIKYRKMFLRGYLKKLCGDPTKMEYWEYLDKVGKMHVGLGRKHPLHVEYIHVGVLLGYVHDILIDSILNHPKLSLKDKTAVVRALTKLLWIQNDLFAKWYVKDGAEFAVPDETEVEPEGFLNGKPTLDPSADEDAIKDGVFKDSVCPFSGMSSAESGSECPASKQAEVETK
jgi:hypothetical protein